MCDDEEERIRQRAFELWEDAGRPEGREYTHWLQARLEITGERPASRDEQIGRPPPPDGPVADDRGDAPPGDEPTDGDTQRGDNVIVSDRFRRQPRGSE